jgi:hypothetical protein
MLDISPVLEFVSRTGEHCVFFNPEDQSFVVLMPLKEYEKLSPKRGNPAFGGFSKQPVREEPFVEPWQPNTPSFVPEPPM